MAGLTRGPLTETCAHLCVDMQNLFARETGWHTPWMGRVVPSVERVAEAHADRTVFTRFIPSAHPGDGEGTWKRYYERWADMTLERLEPGMIDLVPELSRFLPPGRLLDKKVYSPWFQPELTEILSEWNTDTIVITGGETDVCVLAAVLGAVDRGYRVIVAKDCLCSSSDETHDASISLYLNRYGQQVEVASADEVLASWN